MKPNIIAAIFARGGSKGLPGKNIRPLGGKPLIAHSIEIAKQIPQISRVIVSTDDSEIARVAKEFGAEVPFLRPAELARDDSPEWLAWRHLIRYLEDTKAPADIMVSLPTTSPLRNVDDVTRSLDLLLQSDADAVVAVQESERNPYFNMVTMESSGAIQLAAKPEKEITRRQDAPKMYDLTTVVYAVKTRFVMEKSQLFEGRLKAVVVPRERAVDIDTAIDFQIAEMFLSRKGVS